MKCLIKILKDQKGHQPELTILFSIVGISLAIAVPMVLGMNERVIIRTGEPIAFWKLVGLAILISLGIISSILLLFNIDSIATLILKNRIKRKAEAQPGFDEISLTAKTDNEHKSISNIDKQRVDSNRYPCSSPLNRIEKGNIDNTNKSKTLIITPDEDDVGDFVILILHHFSRPVVKAVEQRVETWNRNRSNERDIKILLNFFIGAACRISRKLDLSIFYIEGAFSEWIENRFGLNVYLSIEYNDFLDDEEEWLWDRGKDHVYFEDFDIMDKGRAAMEEFIEKDRLPSYIPSYKLYQLWNEQPKDKHHPELLNEDAYLINLISTMFYRFSSTSIKPLEGFPNPDENDKCLVFSFFIGAVQYLYLYEVQEIDKGFMRMAHSVWGENEKLKDLFGSNVMKWMGSAPFQKEWDLIVDNEFFKEGSRAIRNWYEGDSKAADKLKYLWIKNAGIYIRKFWSKTYEASDKETILEMDAKGADYIVFLTDFFTSETIYHIRVFKISSDKNRILVVSFVFGALKYLCLGDAKGRDDYFTDIVERTWGVQYVFNGFFNKQVSAWLDRGNVSEWLNELLSQQDLMDILVNETMKDGAKAIEKWLDDDNTASWKLRELWGRLSKHKV